MTLHDSLDNQKEWLAGYVLGDLSPEEVAQVEQRIAADPALAQDVDDLRATLSLMALAAPAVDPPVGLRDRLFHQINEGAAPQSTPAAAGTPTHQEAPARNTVVRGRFPLTKALWGAAGSIAAVLVAGLGISNYQLQQEVASLRSEFQDYQETVAMLQQPNNRMLSLQPVADTMSSSGSLVIVPNSDQAVLTLQNLEMPPEGMVYRMWAFVDGEKVDCADFVPDASGEVLMQIPLGPWGDASSVVVNIEPAEEDMPEDGTMVLTGESL